MVPVIILIVVIFVFIGSVYLNSKIEVPQDAELPDKCMGCNLSCNKKTEILTPEIIEQIKADIHCQEGNDERQ